MRIRIAKIQMISVPDIMGFAASARARKRDKGNARYAVCLEAVRCGADAVAGVVTVQSAMTPGFFGSSSGRWKTIFTEVVADAAIFVKIPPATPQALAPRDSPIAKPMKLGPTSSFGRKTRMQIMKKSSTLTRRSPTLIPEVVCLTINRFAAERRKGRPGVCPGVYPHTEPCHTVGNRGYRGWSK